MDLNEKLEGAVIEEGCTIRPNDEKNAPKKSVLLKFDFSACTVREALERAVAPVRINFQNSNRKNFDKLATEYTIEVKPVGVRGTGEVSEAKILAQFSKMSAEKRAEILDKILAEEQGQ